MTLTKHFVRADPESPKWDEKNWKFIPPYRTPFTSEGIAWQRDFASGPGQYAIYFVKEDKDALCSPQARAYHKRKFQAQASHEARYVAYIEKGSNKAIFWFENGERTGATDGYEARRDDYSGKLIYFYVRGSEKIPIPPEEPKSWKYVPSAKSNLTPLN